MGRILTAVVGRQGSRWSLVVGRCLMPDAATVASFISSPTLASLHPRQRLRPTTNDQRPDDRRLTTKDCLLAYIPPLTMAHPGGIMTRPAIPRDGCAFLCFDGYTVSMTDFNRKVEDASARVNKSVAEAADRMEKETAEFIAYLNDEVVPAVRQHSTKALRVAAEKMSRLADYLDEVKSDRR